MSNKTSKSNRGFTLLEVIIAVFIISVGVGGMAAIMPSLISGSSINQSRLVAAYLAQEGIEIVRNIRDTNWLEDHYGPVPVAWDEGFFPMSFDCTTGCEIDYLGVSAPPNIGPYTGAKLKIDPINGYYNYASGQDTKFDRKITVQRDWGDPNNILIITVDVFWNDRGKPYNFSVQEKLYKWY
ncbi:MAG: prepilin-type N-terminal cleavage/methylation domain-containing protein [bacterium]